MAFPTGTVFFLLPRFSKECGKTVGSRSAQNSKAFAPKHGAVFRSISSASLAPNTWTPGKRTKSGPKSFLLNSHDKSSAYQLHCGLFRLVCLNGMVVSDGTFARISIKHSGFNPDSVIEASFDVLEAVPQIMDKVKLFQDRILTDAERLALATGAATYRWEDPNKAPVNPSMLLNPRRYGDGAKDLWTTLNTVQENIIRGGQRDYSRRRPDGSRMPKSRAIKGIDEDMKLNKALWQMAEVLRSGGLQA